MARTDSAATTTRTKKGQVAIINSNNRIQLRFNYGGKRHYLSTGLPYDKHSLAAAKAKASLIESDIAYDRFDPTLAKYKPQCGLTTVEVQETALDLQKLWERYCEVKNQVAPLALGKMDILL